MGWMFHVKFKRIPFEILHKMSYPYIKRYVLYTRLKFYFRVYMCFSTNPIHPYLFRDCAAIRVPLGDGDNFKGVSRTSIVKALGRNWGISTSIRRHHCSHIKSCVAACCALDVTYNCLIVWLWFYNCHHYLQKPCQLVWLTSTVQINMVFQIMAQHFNKIL